MADFRKLRVWQAAQALAIDAHRISQRMRGANAIALRDGRDLQFISEPDFGALVGGIVEVRKMLHGLLKALRARRITATGWGLSAISCDLGGYRYRVPGTGYRL